LLERHPGGAPATDEKHYVLFRMTLNRVAKVDTAEESVFLDFTAQFWWRDANLIGKVGNEFDIPKIWKPNLEFAEVEQLEKVYQPEDCYWINDHLSEHGIICFYQRYKMTLAVPMDLKDFPCDVQAIKLYLTSFTYSLNEMEFVNFCSDKTIDKINETIELTEWELVGSVSISKETQFYEDESRHYSYLILDVPIARRTGFYLQKIFSLLFIIGFMVCGVPLLTSSDLSDRFQITLTLLLSQIAFNFVVGASLPKVSYSTALDYYFLANYVFLCICALENMVVYEVSIRGFPNAAAVIDVVAIFVFLIIHFTNSFIFLYKCFKTKRVHKVQRQLVLEQIKEKQEKSESQFKLNMKELDK